MLKNAITDAKRLAAADRAYQQGDLVLASMIYVRVASSRPKNASTEKARRRLDELREEGRQKLRGVDAKLAGISSAAVAQQRSEQLRQEKRRKLEEHAELSAAAKKSTVVSPRTKKRLAQLREELEDIDAKLAAGATSPRLSASRSPSRPGASQEYIIAGSFEQYDHLAQRYSKVPQLGDEIRRHVLRQRRRAEFAVVLNEPEANELWKLGQQYEQKDERCCAYQVYERAALLTPAPSAELAAEQFAKMKENPEIVRSTKLCRELEWCHRTYRLAERLAKVKPRKAKMLFAQIVRRAPEASEVHRAARMRIQ